MQVTSRQLHHAAVLAVLVWTLSSTAALASRFNKALDDGAIIVVDNYSPWSDTQAGNLAVWADRSTRDDGMLHRAHRGIFTPGDRVFVNGNYLAWFQSSYLLGVWTIDSATGQFLHKRTDISGRNNFVDWSHNEMIRGGASPLGQAWLWDSGSPGIEHSMAFGSPLGPAPLASHHNGYSAPNGNWQVFYDGAVNPLPGLDGVTYATGARLAGSVGGPLVVDVSDGNDSNGIQNYVDSQLAFVCRSNDIKVVWRFKPANAPIAPWRTYYWMWAHYSFDTDNTTCNPNSGNVSPGQTWGEPTTYLSNSQSFVGGNPVDPANQFLSLNRSTPCAGNGNTIRYTLPPQHGTFIRWGESSQLTVGTPRWTLTHQVDASWGTSLSTSTLAFGNETTDGVWGGGAYRDDFDPANPGAPPTHPFSAGVWYTTSYLLSTK